MSEILIPYIEEPISYKEFAQRYLTPNKPCIFGEWITENWNGRKDFATQNGQVDVEKLRLIFGDCENVSVSDCNAPDYGYASSQSMTFSAFLNTWQSSPSLYLKDFHFQRF